MVGLIYQFTAIASQCSTVFKGLNGWTDLPARSHRQPVQCCIKGFKADGRGLPKQHRGRAVTAQ